MAEFYHKEKEAGGAVVPPLSIEEIIHGED